MRTKLLSTIRKHYDYIITEDGKVVTRSKKSGKVKEYDSIEEYVKDVSYTDTLIGHLISHKWNKKKQMIKDSKISRTTDYWDSLSKRYK